MNRTAYQGRNSNEENIQLYNNGISPKYKNKKSHDNNFNNFTNGNTTDAQRSPVDIFVNKPVNMINNPFCGDPAGKEAISSSNVVKANLRGMIPFQSSDKNGFTV